nr:LOW QUALITY PROTEIN: chondroadherin-like protein [Vicugna pacos]
MAGPQSVSLVLLLPLLLPLGPTWHAAAQRCPQTCVCDNSRRHVACRHQNLTEVPDAIPELTQRLDLQGNMLKVIPPAAFQNLPYLTHLDLRHCQVELVAEGAFRGLGRLLLLNLASNHVSALPQEALDGLGSLQRLELESNMLEELRPGTFGALGALATLNLAHNALVYLPSMAFQGLVRMRWLQLSHNCPRACVCAPESRHSGCEGQGLRAVPRGFPNDTQLLDLRRNHFPLVPREAFLGLDLLVSLHLQHCGITELEADALAGLGSLIYLYLSDNRLSGLSAAALEGAPRLGYLYWSTTASYRCQGLPCAPCPASSPCTYRTMLWNTWSPGSCQACRPCAGST